MAIRPAAPSYTPTRCTHAPVGGAAAEQAAVVVAVAPSAALTSNHHRSSEPRWNSRNMLTFAPCCDTSVRSPVSALARPQAATEKLRVVSRTGPDVAIAPVPANVAPPFTRPASQPTPAPSVPGEGVTVFRPVSAA